MFRVADISRQFRELRDDYRSEYGLARPSRFRRVRKDVNSTGASGDAHIGNEQGYYYGIEYVRAMHRDDGMIKQTTRRATQQQVQNGFRLDPMTGDTALDLAIWQDHDDWANDPDQCDVAGESCFADMEQSSFEATIVDGDHFLIGTEDGQLQQMENHRCRTPSRNKTGVVLGVKLDSLRKRLGFHFVKESIEPTKRMLLTAEAPFVPARDEDGVRQVFQSYHADRVSLTRGITAYHPIVDLAGMFDDTNFGLVVKNQIASCFAIFLEQTNAAGSSYNPQTGERNVETIGAGSTLTEITKEGIAPGQKIALPPGIKPHAFSPNIVSSETLAHLRFLLQLIGLNLGMPLVLVLLDASETNFSGWRGALDAAHVGFRCNQEHFERRFHRPIYRWRLHWRMKRDDEFGRDLRRKFDDLGLKLFRHRWHKPTWPYVQPLDDAKADAFCLQNLLKSPRQVSAERGRDIDEIVDETIADNTRAIIGAKAAAKKINETYGKDDPDRVTWRDVLNRDLYRGGQTIDSLDPEQQQKKSAANN